MNRSTRPSSFVILLAALLLTACQPAAKTTDWSFTGPDPAQPQPTTVVSIDAAKLMPQRAGKGQYLRIVGQQPPTTIDYTMSQHDDQWHLNLKDVRITAYSFHADGTLRIASEVEAGDGVRVLYDPGLIAIPADVNSDANHDGSSTMRVLNLSNDSPRDQGPCTYSVQVLGMQRVTTPAGTFDAYIVRTKRQIKLSLADVTVTLTSAYVPGRGLVAEHIDQRTRVLGLFESRKTEQTLLAK